MDSENAPVSEEVKQAEVAPATNTELTATVEETVVEVAPEPVSESLVEEKIEDVNVEPTVDLKVRIFLACVARVGVYRFNFTS